MKKLMLMVLGFASLIFASCLHDTDPELGKNGASGKALKLNFSVQGMGAGLTRSSVNPEAGEEVANSLYLLFFDPSSDRSGEYKGYYPVAAPLIMNTDIELGNLSDYGISPSAAYKVMAVANLDQYTPYLGSISIDEWLNTLSGKTESNVYHQMRAFLTAGQGVAADQLLMTGEADKSTDPLGTIKLTLTRGLVRFDVVNSANNTYDLVSVSIWNAFPEVSIFGGGVIDYSNTSRIRKFYGLDNTAHTDIYGGLYSFPNQVANPGEKDDKTTCLIVGLAPVGGGNTTYHRVNISAEESMQDLKRNNVYRLTIRSVGGDGAGSEEEAYTGGINNLHFQINYWNLDDDGLIKQNGEVILAIPTKRIKFGAEAEERTYDIFAFGGPAGEQIAISTNFEGDAGNNITVTKHGNSITVNARALTNAGDERQGTITVSYAGLSATIAIFQSGVANKFLRVTTPGGVSIPSFAPYSGSIMDGQIAVEASDAWTAKVYCLGSTPYFGIVGAVDPSVINSSALTGNFQVQTIATNDDTAPRQAFILISLDSDETNYNTALVLTQRAQGGISLSPMLTQINWDGSGNLTIPGGISATEFRLQVLPTQDITGYLPWTATLIDGNKGFEIVTQQSDLNTLSDNFVVVKASGASTGALQTDVLRVQLDGNGPHVDVALRQENFNLSITPNTFPEISVKGGGSNAVSVVSNGTSLRWSATISTNAVNGTLTDHAAILVDAVDGTTILGTGDANKYALGQQFKVTFPKVLYGNHLKGKISATVTVKLWNGTTEVRTTSFTIDQSELRPNNVNIANYHGSGSSPNYGNLYGNSSHYSAGWRTFLSTLLTTSISNQAPAYPAAPTTPLTRLYSPNTSVLPTSRATTFPVPTNVTYVHASQANAIPNASNPADPQGAIENWRSADKGVLFIGNQSTYSSSVQLFWPIRKLGWTSPGNANNSAAETVRSGSDKKIRDFIFNKGPFGPVGNDGTLEFYIDGYSLSVDISRNNTGTAVAIIGNDTRASIVIDPVSRVIFIGDDQMFGRGATSIASADRVYTDLRNSKSRLLANLIAYTILTAQYGSHFSDLLVD